MCLGLFGHISVMFDICSSIVFADFSSSFDLLPVSVLAIPMTYLSIEGLY